MKILFLGTGASEGIPGLFCECDLCAKARALGGKNIRTRTSIHIDEKYKDRFASRHFFGMFYAIIFTLQT